jgi:hypothetical protein
MKHEDLNWGKTVADANAISVAIVDDVVGCVSGNCLTICGRNLFQFSCYIVGN